MALKSNQQTAPKLGNLNVEYGKLPPQAVDLEEAVLGRAYPLSDKEYSFHIEKIIEGAIVKKKWKNKSERLLRPAIVAMIEQDGVHQEVVLPLSKPVHQRTKSGVLVLLYRRQPASSGAPR